MASLGQEFDATAVDPSEARDFEVLPAGEYAAAIVKSEKRDSKSGGAYINLEFEIYDGEAKGRRVWTMLNLWNANAQAVEIAQRDLSAICHAVGKLRVSNTEALHGIPMLINVGQKTDSYGTKNVIKGYKPMGAVPPAHQTARTAPPPAAAAGGRKAGPWA